MLDAGRLLQMGDLGRQQADARGLGGDLALDPAAATSAQNTAGYPDWLFVAGEPGIERLAWPIFVHEAMHWYQYQNSFPALLAAERAGVSHDDYEWALETDASCRAVYHHGIDRSAFDGSSSPCDITDWHDGWFVDQRAARGVRTSAPTPEEFEVSAVVRP